MDKTKATVDYDAENDQLSIERVNSVVDSTLEFGDLIFDFDKNGIVCGIEFLAATKLLSIMFSDMKSADVQSITGAKLSQRQAGNNIVVYFSLLSKNAVLESSVPLPAIQTH